jgi:excisionase family DNA binding protein
VVTTVAPGVCIEVLLHLADIPCAEVFAMEHQREKARKAFNELAVPQQEQILNDYSGLAKVALMWARARGSCAPDSDAEFDLAQKVAHGLQLARTLCPTKPAQEWTHQEVIGLGEYRMHHLKVIVAPTPFRPLPTPGDRLAAYGRAITAKELSHEWGVPDNSIAKRMKAGSLPYFHICTCLRFCPVTIARSIQTVFNRVDQPSVIERLIAWGHDGDGNGLAALLYVSYKTILKAANSETLPCYRDGTLVRFNGRAVARWLNAQMDAAQPPRRKPPRG